MVLLPRRAVFHTARGGLAVRCEDRDAAALGSGPFPQVSPCKDDAGQREYTRGQVELVLRVKQLYEREELPVAEVRRRWRSAWRKWCAPKRSAVP